MHIAKAFNKVDFSVTLRNLKQLSGILDDGYRLFQLRHSDSNRQWCSLKTPVLSRHMRQPITLIQQTASDLVIHRDQNISTITLNKCRTNPVRDNPQTQKTNVSAKLPVTRENYILVCQTLHLSIFNNSNATETDFHVLINTSRCLIE